MIFLQPYKKYATFTGRSSRTEYWTFTIFVFLVNLVFVAVATGLSYLFLLISLLPSIALSVRRLHDISKSGWFVLLALIPIIGGIILFIFALLPSTPNENEYGSNPHQTIAADSSDSTPTPTPNDTDVPTSPPADDVSQSPSTDDVPPSPPAT